MNQKQQKGIWATLGAWLGAWPSALLVAVGFVLTPLAAPATDYTFTELTVFGDSLSDNGNAFASSGGTAPPSAQYWLGRFSNGPVWADYVRALLSVQLQNRAFAGSETDSTSSATGAPGLLRQVDDYVASRGGSIPQTAAYVVWSGSNDILRISNGNSIRPAIDKAVANIMLAIDKLRSAGATKIVVANVPDLGVVPLANDNVLALSPQQLTQAAQAFSARLKAAIGTRRHKVLIFDAFKSHRGIIADPTQVGLKNVSQGCLANGCESGNASGPSDYLYWDALHPTTKGHRIIADNIARDALALLDGDWIGLYDPTSSKFRLDKSLKGGATELRFGFETKDSGKTALSGDWKGGDNTGIGVFIRKKKRVRLRLSSTAGRANIKYTVTGLNRRAVAIAGDWNGNGADTLGFYDPLRARFSLKNRHNGKSPEVRFRFGPKGKSWQPVSGDWNGDGKDDVGLYNPDAGTFHLRNGNGTGKTRRVVAQFGPIAGTRQALSGDWDGDGVDGIGLYYRDKGQFFLRDSLTSNPIDQIVKFGTIGVDLYPLSGRWSLP